MITCGIATLKDREFSFKKTIESIYPQVDEIVAVLNYYTEVPEWLRDLRNVKCVIGDNSLGDAGKFLEVGYCNGYYFALDDDLWYPPNNYVTNLIAKIKEYHCIVTLHGKIFANRPIQSYHKSFTTNIHCLHTCERDTVVDVGGSGVMAFDTNDFKLCIDDFKCPNMSDIWVSKIAHEQGIKIMALAHKSHYLRYLYPKGDTIWNLTKGNPYQTEVLNSFLK
jgi:hypothetical protein